MKINRKYLLAFFLILLVEVLIALFIRDRIIRPFIGDVLVVVLVYTLIMAFTKERIKFLPTYVGFFAVIVEIAQCFKVVYLLGLEKNRLISVIIGTTFDFKDIICYLIGTLILFIWERKEEGRHRG